MTREELRSLKNNKTLLFINKHEKEDPAGLALKYSGKTDIPLRAAVEQIKCRQKARVKLPSFSGKDILYTNTALQQASGEDAALYKTGFIKGKRLIDITGGLGIDCYYLSRGFEQVIYCEQNSLLADIAAHNFTELSADNIKVINGDGPEQLNEYPDKYFDWLYADPSRRSGEKRSVDINYLEPNITDITGLLKKKAENICIKLSPAFDYSEAKRLFPDMKSFNVVSLNGENKEVLVILNEKEKELTREAVLLNSKGEQRIFACPGGYYPAVKTSEAAAAYFYEADPAVIRAELAGAISEKFSAPVLTVNNIFMTSDEFYPSFPGRAFRVIQQGGYNKTGLSKYLKSRGISKANVTVRDFPENVNKIRARYKLREGGADYLFFYSSPTGNFYFIHGRKV